MRCFLGFDAEIILQIKLRNFYDMTFLSVRWCQVQQCPACFIRFRFSDGVDYEPSKYSFHSSERLFCDHLRPIGNYTRIGCAKAGSCDVFGQKKDTAVAEIGPIRRKSVELRHFLPYSWHSSILRIITRRSSAAPHASVRCSQNIEAAELEDSARQRHQPRAQGGTFPLRGKAGKPDRTQVVAKRSPNSSS